MPIVFFYFSFRALNIVDVGKTIKKKPGLATIFAGTNGRVGNDRWLSAK